MKPLAFPRGCRKGLHVIESEDDLMKGSRDRCRKCKRAASRKHYKEHDKIRRVNRRALVGEQIVHSAPRVRGKVLLPPKPPKPPTRGQLVTALGIAQVELDCETRAYLRGELEAHVAQLTSRLRAAKGASDFEVAKF